MALNTVARTIIPVAMEKDTGLEMVPDLEMEVDQDQSAQEMGMELEVEAEQGQLVVLEELEQNRTENRLGRLAAFQLGGPSEI